MNKLKAIVLAAGEGKRMKSKIPKVLHKVQGKTMVDWVIDTAKEAGADDICVIAGYGADEVIAELNDRNVKFAIQKEQLGTGHAVMQAGDFIEEDADIIVFYGDTPLITAETIKKMLEFHRREENSISIISANVDNPTGYGHIIRDEKDLFVKNVEHKDANDEEKLVKEINTGIYCFKGIALIKGLSLLKNDNVQKEYYLPDTLEIILHDGGKVNAMVADDAEEFFGVNSKVQLSEAEAVMRKRINIKHMDNGVTIIDPSRTYIDADAVIGCDTILLPGVVIEGSTVIGEDCVVGPDSRLTNTQLGKGVKFQYSTSIDSSVDDNTTVGPYAYIRPNCSIGKNVKIGDFVEIKNSNIGDGTKVSHLTYVGDSDVGKRINFGCGTVTVNYDGHKKFRTVIDDDVFIGCNTNLIAPVKVGKGSYIAAGSTITDEVPENSLAIARERQVNKNGWVKK
ncbi:MAG: bifunctional UDP-N-acetylglucosamine diphosphorylase/glucosamine-1-phosphate N-acetyltransferase GlmU [Candidatus Metalachnospira sp.]|nr:bifunctional UDP-N-acetylglucosamine diphosphorylase/glucosamine-1-phosphate N-acetyltransferase GlmU [Candidatus Metalachnospira sp.]